jgi:SSS family solute:Na+ symporter
VLALLVAGVTVLYTTLGGINAVVWSDLMQLFVLIGGALGVPFYVAWRTGEGLFAWWDVFSQAERASVPVFSLDPRERVTAVGAIVSLFVWHICTHGADQIAAQRYLSTPSLPSARRSFIMFAVGNLVLIGVLMVCGIAIFHFEFRQQSLPIAQFQQSIAQIGDQAFPRFIATELPTGLSGLLLAGILAAAMSSLSSGMNSIAAVLSSGGEPSSAAELQRARRMLRPLIYTMSVGLIATGIALIVDYFMRTYSWNLITLMNRINHLFVAPLGAMFLGAIWFRRIGVVANLIGLACGIVTSFLVSFSGPIFGYEISFTWIMPAAFVVNLGVALALSSIFPSRQLASTPATAGT